MFPLPLTSIILQGRTCLMGVFRDITERKQSQALQQAIYQIATAAETSTSLDELYPQIHQIIATVMPAENFFIALYDQADNLSLAAALADILVLKGIETHVVSSGVAALQFLQDHHVDVLLTDVIMPEMDGVALYRRTRQAYPQLITILMTAYAADELIQKGMAEGIKTVLTKPIDIDFLLLLLSTYKKRKSYPLKKTGKGGFADGYAARKPPILPYLFR